MKKKLNNNNILIIKKHVIPVRGQVLINAQCPRTIYAAVTDEDGFFNARHDCSPSYCWCYYSLTTYLPDFRPIYDEMQLAFQKNISLPTAGPSSTSLCRLSSVTCASMVSSIGSVSISSVSTHNDTLFFAARTTFVCYDSAKFANYWFSKRSAKCQK